MALRRRPWLVPVLLVSLLLAMLPGAVQATVSRPTPPQPVHGTSTAVKGWSIHSSKDLADGGEKISRPGYDARKWCRTGPRSTVMAGLIGCGRFTDEKLFYSTNLKQVDPAEFSVPWWYRTEVNMRPSGNMGGATFLKLNGIIAKADIWVNGKQVADSAKVKGAYGGHELDVTSLVRRGRNAVAIRTHPGHHDKDLQVWFLDWNPTPPDNSMGVWRDVDVLRNGAVSLRDARVVSDLKLPGLETATLTVRALLRNNTDKAVRAGLNGSITPPGGGAGMPVRQQVTLQPRQSQTVETKIQVDRPKIWWPAQWGGQPLYRMKLTAHAGGAPSDSTQSTFGIRDVRSELTKDRYRQFYVNGRPFLVRAGGYTSDMFLRWKPDYVEKQFRYWRDLGLNAVRMEGKLEHPEFYDLADRYGIMLLPGWECCDKWEGYNRGSHGEPWTDDDYRVAGESMAHEARMMRDHPSVLGFLVASDFWPDDRAEKAYLDALKPVDWQTPVISSAAMRGKPPQLGWSGMKMDGPYDWVPPNYWYGDKYGAAFGFGSELGAGVGTPEMESLRSFLSESDLEQLWKEPKTKLYHMSTEWSKFATREIYSTALAARYGQPENLEDYVSLAQIADYEAIRAQFEAYGARMDAAKPATGLVYWMLNNGWPSLHWHMYDSYLRPGGSYFGAKKANEALHVQYGYDERSVTVVNNTGTDAKALTATAEVYDLDGSRKFSKEAKLDVAGNRTGKAFAIPEVPGLGKAHFLKLTLRDKAGKQVSRNVYWNGTEQDELDWPKSTWYHTPVKRYADLSGLRQLSKTKVDSRVRSTALPGGWGETTVTLRNTSPQAIAFAMRLSLRRGTDGPEVLPVTWTDNYVTLTGAETITVKARYRLSDLGGAKPSLKVTGRNLTG